MLHVDLSSLILMLLSIFAYDEDGICFSRPTGCLGLEDILYGLRSLYINMKRFYKSNGKVPPMSSFSQPPSPSLSHLFLMVLDILIQCFRCFEYFVLLNPFKKKKRKKKNSIARTRRWSIMPFIPPLSSFVVFNKNKIDTLQLLRFIYKLIYLQKWRILPLAYAGN